MRFHRRLFRRFARVCVVLFCLLASCTSPTNQNNNNVQPHAKPDGCHPLASDPAQGCLLPFPSSYYMRSDDASPTGFRVAFPDKLPASNKESEVIPTQPSLFNDRDGFSPSSPLMVLFDKWVDPKTLPPSTDLAGSVKAESNVQLIEFGTRTRIPLFAEVDRNAKEGEPQVVLIRPMVRLKPKSRYAVIILKDVKAVDGSALSVPAIYQKLAQGEAPTTPAHAALAPLIQETLKEAEAAGIAKDKILLSWDFRTATDETLFARSLAMRDEVIKLVGDQGPRYTFTTTQERTTAQDASLWRVLVGEMEIPSFLSKDDPNGILLLDEKGKPKIRGEGKFHFRVHIPHCVKTQTKPVPIMVFGHGLFGSTQEMLDPGSHQPTLIQRLCMVQIGHNWIGLSRDDLGPIGLSISNFNLMPHLADRLLQAHMNAVAMIKMAKGRLTKDPQLQHDGKPIIDGKHIYYLGISNGAIQGGTLMGLTPDITRAVLNVGGGSWALMMSRSSNFSLLSNIMKTFYPNPVDRQLLVALLQPFLDYVDPVTYAPYLINDAQKVLNVPNKQIIIQEGIDDAQVPNLATRLWARTMGVPGLKPLFEPVFGLELQDAPFAGSAYTQYGPRFKPTPKDENVPPLTNASHGASRKNEAALKQIEAFFKSDGNVTQHCDGPCDPT